MKYLIMFLLVFEAYASFLPKSKVGKNTDGMTIYSNKDKCEEAYEEDCISAKGLELRSYHEAMPSKWIKEQSQACEDDQDCQGKFEALNCESEFFRPIKNLDLMEVYCTKFKPEYIAENKTKKNKFEKSQKAKAKRLKSINKGKVRRQKCENAMSYLSGAFADSSEAETDAIFNAFSEIDSALTRCKYKKAKRLIGEIADQNYSELKTELLEILK